MPKVPERMTDAYLKLVERLPLVPIQDELGLDRAIALIDELLAREVLTPEEDDYLDDLGNLVYVYEEVHWPVPEVAEEPRGVSSSLHPRRLDHGECPPISTSDDFLKA